jgi:hypothetical protein
MAALHRRPRAARRGRCARQEKPAANRVLAVAAGCTRHRWHDDCFLRYVVMPWWLTNATNEQGEISEQE